jgi:hypothetical protein
MEQDALVPILKPCPFCGDRPPDCADRHFRGSMRRLRRNGTDGSEHGACGSEMEQKEGGRFRLVIHSPVSISRMLEATFSGYGAPRPVPLAVSPSVAFCQRSGQANTGLQVYTRR